MKLWNYLVIFTGVAIFMTLAGLPVAGFSDLFSLIGLSVSNNGIGSFNIQSTLWTTLFGTSGLLVVAGTTTLVSAGLYVYTKDKSLLMVPVITSVFIYWVSVLVSIVNYTREYPIFGFVASSIMAVLTIGFIVSCIDYFLGVD